ncbi:VanZ family protein [Aeromicrobium sp. UC242_57]|uniref:VanZ family protein n=1 Tax=Aeromicrobium sp. UC242_57 TaxID=3374624 RepID=UPI00379AE628
MTSAPHEISALPVVVPLAALAFAAMLWRLHRRAAWSIPRVVVAAAVCVYGAGIIANTVFPILIDSPASGPSWPSLINLALFVDTEWFDMLSNVLVFVPLGFLLPLVTRARTPRRVALYGFAISLTMETAQFVNAVTGHGGHIADVNDLLANSLGAVVGYALFRACLRLPAARRLADAARWTEVPWDDQLAVSAIAETDPDSP